MATAQSKQNNDWLDTSKQYWDSWFEAQRKAMGSMNEQNKNFGGMQGQWSAFFDEWQKLTSTKDAQPGADMFRQLFVKTGEGFIGMLEQFYQAAGQAKPPEESLKEWMGMMQSFFEGSLAKTGQPFDPAAQYKNFTESMAHAGPSFWTNAFKSNPFMGEKADHQMGNLFDPFGFYASVPGIGYTREKQDHLNKLYRLFVDYEGKMRQYNNEMTRVGLQALHEFHDYLKNPPKDDAPLESLKSVYSKWTDVCEEVFAKYAMSEDYTKLYGEVVNALMSFKKQSSLIADDMVEQMNLPTRTELDSLHLRVQEMRRENARLRKAVEQLLKSGISVKEKPAPATPAAKAPAAKPAAKKAVKKPAAKPAAKSSKKGNKK